MAGAESRPPRREKNGGEAWLAKARFFSRPPSAPVNSFFANPIGQSPFLHTLSVTDGKKFVFGTRSRLRTGKKFTPPRRRAPEKKLCIFSVTGGEKVCFCTRYRLRTGKTTRSVGIFLALAFAGARSAAVLQDRTQQICDGKRKHSNEKFFPTVLAYTFASSPVEIRKGRIPKYFSS